ncbi:MAG TPA: TIGR03435 family protein [Bryobacteraceae bacterium]|nr:TIGR03435 family protein [Bryobacteraceae bacterium]
MIRAAVKVVLAVLLLFGAVKLIRGQASAEKLPSFDVISVKPGGPEGQTRSIFPLGPGDVYITSGGHFSAEGYPLATYLYFAFQVLGSEMNAVQTQLPGWAISDPFTIEARTDGDPAKDTKDQMRLMMRSLLAERFGLKSHYETREVSIFAVGAAKTGKLGPQLQQHSEGDSPCNTVLSTGTTQIGGTTVAGGYPAQCGGLLGMAPSMPGRLRVGARNVAMAFIANQLTALGDLGRPAVDQTGLTGTFDFVIEFVPENLSRLPVGPDFQPDPDGPTFSQAVREQLGLKLDSTKGMSQFLIIDHVERPTGN